VAALQRAVALEQMHDIAVAVAEHLHLDMAGRLDVFLDQHASSPKAAASRCAPASAVGEVAGSSTRRMPLPPPPATALISTG
jgi:hypothetical protein